MSHLPKPFHLLAIDLEPAPYKVDLWNAFANDRSWRISVFFTNEKDVSKDAGHNYQELPNIQFKYQILSGNSLSASIKKITYIFRSIFSREINGVFISGYVDAAPLTAILACILASKPFFLHSDIFNIENPKPPFSIPKLWARTLIRLIIFRYSDAILVCGKLGYESALLAGCSQSKVIDFPYVVDRGRLLSDEPTSIPLDVEKDANTSRLSLYFSGRMIARKGLITLLESIAHIERSEDKAVLEKDWIVWIAGDGPLLSHYQNLAQSFGISHRVRFLGFVQMKLHSWLLRNASIVVVPSLTDAWGIVVDEGMQLGKSVIASSGVGSAVDRIEPGKNGLLFTLGDVSQLTSHLLQLLSSDNLREILGKSALHSSRAYSPKRNIENLQRLLGRSAKVGHEG